MPASTSENNFRFINSYSHKGIKTSKDTRRDVRSYVARISHTNSGRGKAAQSRENGQRSKVIFDVEISSFQDDENEDDRPSLITATAPPWKKTSPPTDNEANHRRLSYKPRYSRPPASHNNRITQATPPYTRGSHRPPSPPKTLFSSASLPFSSSPVSAYAFTPAVLNNYITNLAVPTPEFDDDSPRPLLRTNWLPMILSSPTIFNVIVLTAAAFWAVTTGSSMWSTCYTEILRLKGVALTGLMKGLGVYQSQERRRRDSSRHEGPTRRGIEAMADEECLIAAMCKMASFEAIFGEKSNYHMHMSSLRRLLSQRSQHNIQHATDAHHPMSTTHTPLTGIASLTANGPVLGRLLRFVDTNSAVLLGTQLYLSDDVNVGVGLPRGVPIAGRRLQDVQAQSTATAVVDAQVRVEGQAVEGVDEEEHDGEERLLGYMRRVERAQAAVDATQEGGVDLPKFVGLCGTGTAARY